MRRWCVLVLAACGGKAAASSSTPADPPDPLCPVLDTVVAAAPGGFASLPSGYGPDDRENGVDTTTTPIRWTSMAEASSTLAGELIGTTQRVGDCLASQHWQHRPTSGLLALDQVNDTGTEVEVQGQDQLMDGPEDYSSSYITIIVVAPPK